MSGNWDDSDTDSEPVDVVEKPVILPRARQPSIAKSLEKNAILESSVAGSVKDELNDDSDDDSLSVGSGGSDFEEEDGTAMILDFDATTNMKKMISQFYCEYRNIIMEFADVEIFLISLDSLIVECAAHAYHNWQHGGQSLLIATQIDRYLQHFIDLGGKFKLVVFTDFAAQFARDTTLAFARACAIAHVASSPLKKDLVFFSSPVDSAWVKFLRDLTPSFMMVSTENVTKELCAQEDVNIVPQLETIVLHVLSEGIPIVWLNSVAINFATVEAHYVNPRLVVMHNWDSFVAAHWDCNSELLKNARNPVHDGSQFKTIADFWTKIIKETKASNCSENFDSLASALILSALVTSRRGGERIYLPDKENPKRGLDVIRDRRSILTTATAFMEKCDFSKSTISLADLFDGRMIFNLFDYIVANEEVLPYRLQEDFAKYHVAAELSKPLAVDTTDKLFEPIDECSSALQKLPFLYSVKSKVIDNFIPEMKNASSENIVVDGTKQDYVDWFKENMSWKLRPIEGQFAENEQKIEDAWQQRRANKSRQYLSRWYEMFANSLEGRGTNLLVDFSRAPKGYATAEEADDKQKKGKGWAGQKQGGGNVKKGKEPAKSKKELILEANKKAKDNKAIESEKIKIKFATQQGKLSVNFLIALFPSLDLPETKSLCLYEITMREAKEIISGFSGAHNVERRRTECITLVGHLKDCFIHYWQYLDDKQKGDIVDLWVSLGFEPPANIRVSSDAKQKKLDLNMNMIYYQLEYGGQLIDILADPQRDDRVTGFNPDGWQRSMLDSVDRGHSAVIIAPTSAGKTFISYYCVEKVLRASDEDVVVLVSPSKALMNQMCGSIYARFKNKSMTRGKALFGVLCGDYRSTPLTCQVLVTVPESFESLLLSTEKEVQEFVSKIKYVVFDEVHSIGASEEAHIWEHLLLTIRCPFLALSATIGNASKLHSWLMKADAYKTNGKRKVDLISYGERYSELELSVVEIEDPGSLEEAVSDENSTEQTSKGSGVLKPLMPYGVYMPEKIKMFGIPDDQQLTARQILELYNTMAKFDEKTKAEFEPCHYFGYKKSENVWISRASLREFEQKLKERFLDWLQNGREGASKVLDELGGGVIKKQLDYRALPFKQLKVALENIVPLVDNLRDNAMLPAICFSDDRHVCESLAEQLAAELEKRELEFMATDEFKNNYAIKDEDKLIKLAKRKRDAAEKKKEKKKGDKDEEREDRGGDEEEDVLGAQKARLKQVLERFKLRGRGGGDKDLYDKFHERLSKGAKQRESTRLLLRLFERGIGFHHAGLNMTEKGAVEVLFRSGHLAVLFSTSTLALGVNMPCKTVIFGVDTPHLTPLMYRQMSGRAGRRGFDHSGNVVFLSVPTSKMRRLLTASLSNLQGNPPFSATFLLRLLSYVHQKDIINPETGAPLVTLDDRMQVALTILNNSFSLFTKREQDIDVLRGQIKMYTGFCIQLLRHLQLLTDGCNGKNLFDLAAYLPEKEIGILPFIHLLQKGAFHHLIKSCQGNKDKAKNKILLVLAHLFSRRRLPLSFQPDDKSSYPNIAGTKCHLFLPGLPEDIKNCLNEYNSTTLQLYRDFMTSVSKDNNLLAPVFRISGQSTADQMFSTENLVPPVFDGYSHDNSFLPIINVDTYDYRGRKIYYNAYILDMFANESRELLATVNKIPTSTMWYTIHDFNEVLHCLTVGLDLVARPQDAVAEVMRDLYTEFDRKFRTMFGMKMQ